MQFHPIRNLFAMVLLFNSIVRMLWLVLLDNGLLVKDLGGIECDALELLDVVLEASYKPLLFFIGRWYFMWDPVHIARRFLQYYWNRNERSLWRRTLVRIYLAWCRILWPVAWLAFNTMSFYFCESYFHFFWSSCYYVISGIYKDKSKLREGGKISR